MIGNILLIASALIFVAVSLYARVKSKLGAFIMLSGLFVALINLIYVVVQLV